MLDLGFKNNYQTVHLTPEIGKSSVGGICTFMNELYSKRNDSTGFVQIVGNVSSTIDKSLYTNIDNDTLIIGLDEAGILGNINCSTLVVHFYFFGEFINETIINNKNIVYVIHSIQTTEPWDLADPFNNKLFQNNFEFLCNISKKLICVSNAEKEKLIKIYPMFKDKIEVIYNGISFNSIDTYNKNYENRRKVFGYIGRMDICKGVYEMIKNLNDFDASLKIASGKPNSELLQEIITYLKDTNSFNKVDFLGWCYDERKENFFKSIDALIIPSLYEPFGYIALEAMKHGVPIISSNNGGLKEILGEDYRYLFNPYDDREFKRIIELFMSDENHVIEEQLKKLKERLLSFSTQNMVDNYNIILNEL